MLDVSGKWLWLEKIPEDFEALVKEDSQSKLLSAEMRIFFLLFCAFIDNRYLS